MANVRDEWRGASALSCEICEVLPPSDGITTTLSQRSGSRCPCRSQARTIPFVDTVLFHFKNFCLWHMKKILPSSNPNRKSLL
ncbi:hypothetical protein [Bacteroides sp. AM54-2NS]|uniref:hypothetical protein n=1 Tax=Bacteroides sp. AM54-2NS TaxID=2292955 RepID=UPI00254010CA|nr:hypothetical protein [Bacteroides sp. AM54-2NS]